jgi:hypothetical protein
MLSLSPVQYFAAPENQALRVVKLLVVKLLGKPPVKLNLEPFPKDLTSATFA